MSICDLLVCEGKSAMLLFCMFNVQTGVQLQREEASQSPRRQAYGCLIIRLCCHGAHKNFRAQVILHSVF